SSGSSAQVYRLADGPADSRAAGASAGILQLLEFRLVDGLLVGLLAGDLALIQQLLDRGVHGAHAELPTRLHGVLELVELALAYEIGGSRGVHQDFERRHAALPVGALRSEEHTSELQSHLNLVCRLLLEKKKRRYSAGDFSTPVEKNSVNMLDKNPKHIMTGTIAPDNPSYREYAS